MLLEGLLPLRRYLLDVPLNPTDFDTATPQQRARKAKGRGQRRRSAKESQVEHIPFDSMLTPPVLRELEIDCPGASERLRKLRLACHGYFLAE